jgi:hypothetical protein
MKIITLGVKLLQPNPARPQASNSVIRSHLSAVPRRLGGAIDELTPFARAVKGIFVKANGLVAYRKAFGLPR